MVIQTTLSPGYFKSIMVIFRPLTKLITVLLTFFILPTLSVASSGKVINAGYWCKDKESLFKVENISKTRSVTEREAKKLNCFQFRGRDGGIRVKILSPERQCQGCIKIAFSSTILSGKSIYERFYVNPNIVVKIKNITQKPKKKFVANGVMVDGFVFPYICKSLRSMNKLLGGLRNGNLFVIKSDLEKTDKCFKWNLDRLEPRPVFYQKTKYPEILSIKVSYSLLKGDETEYFVLKKMVVPIK